MTRLRALLGFTGKVYPDNLDYIEKVLSEAQQEDVSRCC